MVQVLLRGLGEAPETRLPDCKAAVFGLTQLLKEAIYRPGPLACQVLSVLLQFLKQLYTRNAFTATTCVLRINVSSHLLRLLHTWILVLVSRNYWQCICTKNHQYFFMSCSFSDQVFNCLLCLRANSTGQLGFHDNDSNKDIDYSPFHVCTLSGGQRSTTVPQSVLELGGVFEAVTACLEKVSQR